MASWVTRHNPKRDPKFQKTEILVGVGRSTRAPFAILNKGWVLRRGADIMKGGGVF